MFIDLNDLSYHNPLLKWENIFEVDEKKIIDYLHTFTCNQNSRMFQKTESDYPNVGAVETYSNNLEIAESEIDSDDH